MEVRQLLYCGGIVEIESTSASEAAGIVYVPIRLAGANCTGADFATVDFSTTDSTATSGSTDYTSSAGTVTFTGNGQQLIPFYILHDGTIESDEGFHVGLGNPTNTTIHSNSGSATITISDSGLASLTIDDVRITEDNTNAIVTIRASQAAHPTITGSYSTVTGAAASGSDFTSSTGAFSIGSGTTAVTISIPILEDALDEWDEGFLVTLSAVNGANVSDATAVVTITDDDGATPTYSGGRNRDGDSRIDQSCTVCSSTSLFFSTVNVWEGSFVLDSSLLLSEFTLSDMLIDVDLLPSFDVAEAGFNMVQTKATVPASPGVPDSFILSVTLRDPDSSTPTTLPDVYFESEDDSLTAGQEMSFATIVDPKQLGLATGRYLVESKVTAVYDSTGTTTTVTTNDSVMLLNRTAGESAYGKNWWVKDFDRLYLDSSGATQGAVLVRGDATTTYFSKSGGTFTNDTPGSFSSLTEGSDGGGTYYLLTTRYNEKVRFNSSGLMTSRWDAQGNETVYNVSTGKVTTVTDPFGRVTTYVYDGNDKLDYVEDPAGRRVDYSITSNLVQSVTYTDPDDYGGGNNGSDVAPSFAFAYYNNTHGLATDFLNTVNYSSKNSVDDGSPTNHEITLHYYDAAGQFSSFVNPDTSSWSLVSSQYKSLDYLSLGKGSNGNKADVVKVAGTQAEFTNERGHKTYYRTDAFGYQTEIVDANNSVTKIVRNSYGQPTQIWEPDSSGAQSGTSPLTQFEYDSYGNKGHLERIVHPDGSEITFDSYNSTYGIPTLVTDEVGRVTKYTIHSGTGLITKVAQIVGVDDDTSGSDDIKTQFLYTNGSTDTAGNSNSTYSSFPKGVLLSVTDAEGIRTDYAYYTDSTRKGWLQKSTENASAASQYRIETQFDYDNYGNVTSITDGESRTTTYTFDKLDRLKKIVEPYPFTDSSYFITVDNGDTVGNPHAESGGSWTNATGSGFQTDQRKAQGGTAAVATWTFNNLVPGKTYEIAATWNSASDTGATNAPFEVFQGAATGSAAWSGDINQSSAPGTHPLFGSGWRALTKIRATGSTLTIRLKADNAGHTVSSSQYVLADAVRLGEAAPETSFAYNALGDLLTTTDPHGAVVKYVYDNMSRVVQLKEPDPDGGGTPITTSYSYDAAGNLLKIAAPLSDINETEYVYDKLHRVEKIKLPYPSPNGGVTIDDSVGDTTKFQKSSSGWTSSGNGFYATTGDGSVWADWKFTGLVPGKTYELFANWDADAVNNATNAQYTVYNGIAPSDGTPGSTFTAPPTVSHAAATGNHAALGSAGNNWKSIGTFTVTGEKLSVRLTNAAQASRRVFANGMMLVEARPETTYDFSPNYNLASVTDALGSATQYAYDARHRITTVTEADPDGDSGGASSPITKFRYDAASQLLQLTDPLGLSTRYFYDDDLARLKEVRASHPDVTAIGLKDNDSSGVTYPAGSWTSDTGAGHYNSNYKWATGATAQAEWAFTTGIVAGTTYEVFATWKADNANAAAAPTSLISGGTTVAGTINQSQDPTEGDLFGDATKWQSLGVITIPGGQSTLTVRFDGQSGKTLVADAIRVMPKAPTTSYQYDKIGNTTHVTDALGNDTVYDYDEFYRLQTTTLPDPDASVGSDQPIWNYVYDKVGNLKTIVDPLSNETTYLYDRLNRMVQMTLPDPEAVDGDAAPVYRYDFDLVGNNAGYTDPLGNKSLYQFDLWNRLKKATYPKPIGSESENPFTEYVYDALSRVTSITENMNDSIDAITQYQYDGLGRLIQTTLPDPDGTSPTTDQPVYKTAYDMLGNVVQETDARNNSTRYSYDRLYRLTQTTLPDPDGGGDQLSPFTRYTYDAGSQLSTVVTTLKNYTSGGSPVEELATTSYVYDRLGRRTQVTLPDPADNASSADQPVHHYTYDAVGNLTRWEDPFSNDTDYSYDNLYRLKQRLDPDPNNNPSTGNGRPKAVYTYDRTDNVTSVKQSNERTSSIDNVTTFVYDDLGRLWQEDIALDSPTGGDTRTYNYDAAGNLTKKLDRNERKVTYSYDHLNRMREEKWFDNDADTTESQLIKYERDYLGNIVDADSNAANDGVWESKLHYGYDRLSRVTGVGIDYDGSADVADLSVDYAIAYDKDGYRDTFAASIGPSSPKLDFINDYTFDAIGRLTTLTQAAQGDGGNFHDVAPKRVDFAYRADGQFDKITRYRLTTADTAYDVIRSSYTYDKMGRLTELKHDDMEGSSVERSKFTHTYDLSNRLATSADRFNANATYNRDLSYGYDETNQITSVTLNSVTTSYSFDENGNRTMSGYATGKYNRITKDATYGYTYDDEGNQTARTVLDTGVREAMEWDHRNRLTSITSQTPREVAHWRFDGDATNSAGNSDLDGTLVNGATYASGSPISASGGDQYLSFDGVNDYVSMGNEDALKIRNRAYFSVSAWFKPDDNAATPMTILEQGNPVNAGNGSGTGGSGFRIMYRPDQSPKYLEFIVNDGMSAGGSQTSDIDGVSKTYAGSGLNGGWHQVVATFASADGGNMKLYVDGALVASGTHHQNDGDIVGTDFQVGSQGGGSPGYFYRYIDDVRVWHELVDDDVDDLYASTAPLYKTTKTVQYEYDAFDRRVRKRVNANADVDNDISDVGDSASQYVYDGDDIVLAFDKNAALTNRYLHGPAVDQILADEQYGGDSGHDDPTAETGNVYWPLTDHLGSVRQLVDNNGEEVKRINYDGFGQMTVESGAIDHIFGYTGREHDAESHLQYNRARYYDAAIGRWISEDPLGFAAGDENLSRYVGNGPTNGSDPSGEEMEFVTMPDGTRERRYVFTDRQQLYGNEYFRGRNGRWRQITNKQRYVQYDYATGCDMAFVRVESVEVQSDVLQWYLDHPNTMEIKPGTRALLEGLKRHLSEALPGDYEKYEKEILDNNPDAASNLGNRLGRDLALYLAALGGGKALGKLWGKVAGKADDVAEGAAKAESKAAEAEARAATKAAEEAEQEAKKAEDALRKQAEGYGRAAEAPKKPIPHPSKRTPLPSPQKPPARGSTVSPSRRRHILDGDRTGGGHRPGTGLPGKSEFPHGWSDDKIVEAVEDVANNPAFRGPGRGDRVVARGTRDGVEIEVILEPNGDIVTGYPTNVPRNPRPPR